MGKENFQEVYKKIWDTELYLVQYSKYVPADLKKNKALKWNLRPKRGTPGTEKKNKQTLLTYRFPLFFHSFFKRNDNIEA